jgi:hypothetical protein
VGGSWTWRKSSHSGDPGDACVEVAWTGPLVHIRDTKHPDSPTLTVPRRAWQTLLDHLRHQSHT